MSKYRLSGILLLCAVLMSPACSSDNGHNEPSCDTVLIMLGLDRRDGALADFVYPDGTS